MIWIARYIILWVITLIGLMTISVCNDLTTEEAGEAFAGLVYIIPLIICGLWWAIGYLV